MATLSESIGFDLKEAQKKRDEKIVAVLRMLSAAIRNKEIEKRTKLSKMESDNIKLKQLSQLTDEETIDLVSTEVKKRKEASEQFMTGGRNDLAQKEQEELSILAKYLPIQLTEDELRQVIRDTLQKLAIAGSQNFGKVMSVLMPKLRGRADGNLVTRLLKEELNK